jgi:DNA polymerase III delta subunit
MLLDDLLKYGNDPIYITGMLKWKLQQLITVKKLMIETNLPEKKILKKAGLNVYVNRGMCRNLKNYSQERLLEAYDRLFKTEIRMKSSGVDSRFLIEEYSIWFMTES